MAAERCGKCDSDKVRRSGKPWRHALRVILASQKRFCLDCGAKWHVSEDPLASSSTHVSTNEVMLLASLAAIVAAALLESGGNPIGAAKRLVRSYYDDKYDDKAKERLKEDWGWLYGGQGEMQKDYQDHSKN